MRLVALIALITLITLVSLITLIESTRDGDHLRVEPLDGAPGVRGAGREGDLGPEAPQRLLMLPQPSLRARKLGRQIESLLAVDEQRTGGGPEHEDEHEELGEHGAEGAGSAGGGGRLGAAVTLKANFRRATPEFG